MFFSLRSRRRAGGCGAAASVGLDTGYSTPLPDRAPCGLAGVGDVLPAAGQRHNGVRVEAAGSVSTPRNGEVKDGPFAIDEVIVILGVEDGHVDIVTGE